MHYLNIIVVNVTRKLLICILLVKLTIHAQTSKLVLISVCYLFLQMLLHLAEASRHFGCTEIFREPSKFALSDCYEEHFLVPYKRIVIVTNKRVVLLQVRPTTIPFRQEIFHLHLKIILFAELLPSI